MSATINIRLNQNLYLRNPEETELGRKIVTSSIDMINRLGLEQFTFKKLAREINSTEASVYRYFENKHKLLIYLVCWYWSWLGYRILFHTNNIQSPTDRLKIIINILAQSHQQDADFIHIDEAALYRIVVGESSKTYFTKEVDSDNKDGLFGDYKSLCRNIAGVIREIAPNHPFSHALASTIVEAAHQQIFFAEHLPSLTEVKEGKDTHTDLAAYLSFLTFSSIKNCNEQ